MRKISMVLLRIAFVLFLPLIIPAVLLLESIDQRRIRAAALRFRCLRCGNVLGRNAIPLANAEWARRVEEAKARSDGDYPRMPRDVHAICPQCGTRYRFVSKTRTFIESPPMK